MTSLVPLRAPRAAVSRTAPGFFRVIATRSVPLTSRTEAGDTAWPSLAVRATAPVNPVTMLPYRSLAVIVTSKAVPAVALAGAVTVNEASAAGTTVTAMPVPVTAPIAAVRRITPARVRTTAAEATPLVIVRVFGV